MNLRKRRQTVLWWIAIVIGCMMLSQVAMADSSKLIEAGKSMMTHCEAQNIEVPVNFKAALTRFESFNESKSDESRMFIQPKQTASMAFVSEIIEMEWNGSIWVNVSKETDTMNDSMTEMQSAVIQVWDGSGWVNSDRVLFTNNAQGDITSMAMDIWQNGAWVPQMLMTYTFDGSGNLIEDIMQMDMYYSGVLENLFRSVYTYSGNQLTKQENYMWYSSWQKTSETDFTYNGQGQLVEEVDYMDLGAYIFWTNKLLYTYHANGRIETETHQSYDIYTSSWVNDDKYTYTYNGSQQRTSTLEQTWNGSVWVNVYLNSVTYGGPNGMATEDLDQMWNGSAWENVDRSTYGYDSNGNETTWLDEAWNETGASWENEERGTTVYNSSDFPTLTIIQTWVGGAWVNETRLEYTYSGGTAVEDLPINLPESFSMTNYPNPFNPTTTIQFALPVDDQVSVTIYDAMGRMVRTLIHSESITAGTYEVQWNGMNASSQPVASGVYFYSIQGVQFNQTNRCLLLK
ncbi:T9SS type A sorting domain-containing protein [candidate division KSB1 bacterium]|nr:T9SS type A sorting domain-containing protein [candidate division KSB1 bacterium]